MFIVTHIWSYLCDISNNNNIIIIIIIIIIIFFFYNFIIQYFPYIYDTYNTVQYWHANRRLC